VIQFGLRNPLLPGGGFIKPEPENQPEKTGGAGENEGHLPSLLVTEMDHAPGNEQGGHHGAEVGAAVEDARGEGTLAFGKPFRHGFDGRWKVAGFTDGEETA